MGADDFTGALASSKAFKEGNKELSEMTKNLKTMLVQAFELHTNIVKGYELIGQKKATTIAVQPGSQDELEPVCSEESLQSTSNEGPVKMDLKILQKRVDKQEKQIAELQDALSGLHRTLSTVDHTADAPECPIIRKSKTHSDRASEKVEASPTTVKPSPSKRAVRYSRSMSRISSDDCYSSSRSGSLTGSEESHTSSSRSTKASDRRSPEGSADNFKTVVLRNDPSQQQSDKFKLMQLITDKIANGYFKHATVNNERESTNDTVRTRKGHNGKRTSRRRSITRSNQRRRSYSPQRRKRTRKSSAHRST